MKDKYYEYFNPNPKGNETYDCVIRAICAVTGLSWYEVYDKCCEVGREHCTLPNSNDIAKERNEAFGLVPRVIPRPKKGQSSLTVQKFCEQHKKGKYILSTADHSVAVVDGKYYDLYVNYGQKVYKYYEKVQGVK